MNTTLYIIGNGPSLADVDMAQLQGQDCISFNRAYIAWEDWGFDPKYFMCIDMRVMKDIAGWLNDHMDAYRQTGFILRDHVEFGLNVAQDITGGTNTMYLPLINGAGVGKSWGALHYCGDVASCSIQVARLLGYKRCVLLGCDCRWNNGAAKVETDGDLWRSTGDDPNHFRSDYYGKGREYTRPDGDAHLGAWDAVHKAVASLDIDVVSATPYSRLNELFGYVPLASCIEGGALV
jgi:hypothetical protein